ncbi:RsmE family RNA methyltransferase [Crocinitomix algicola]|uniref:RsmE family RNA methyltransferase n=1 Tax=Crocinitomix algicola TaxID=1740263 RepID=UPI000834BDEB|nr:RsmE family RNA methyltransferase [Crocinitomix algicola]
MSTAKHTFFCEQIESGFLSEEESNHAIRVLRLKEQEQIKLIDGKGQSALGRIIDPNKKRVQFQVDATKTHQKPKQELRIVIAPTKNMDRFSFFVEKVIEIGIERISPVITSNSERKNLNIEKVRKGAIAALKQSGNYFLPQIDDLVPIQHVFNDSSGNHHRYIAHCEDDENKTALKTVLPTDKKVEILIGPEGDFTKEEIILAKENGYLPVSLGESRLRTETAGIVACHTVNIIS